MNSQNKKYSVGIDIGGTKIRAVLWNGGKIVASFGVKTPKTKREFVKTLKRIFKKAAGKGAEIKAAGIGAAGIVEGRKVVSSPNIPYLKNFDFRGVFPALPLKVDNDARAFLAGEFKLGSLAKNKKILAFTAGTGIGRAFSRNGKVKKINKFEYPEKWEKEYQRIRDFENNAALAGFLGGKLSPIIEKYKPDIVLIGGGILKRKDFFNRLRKELDERISKVKFKKSTSVDSAAVGAALLWRRI